MRSVRLVVGGLVLCLAGGPAAFHGVAAQTAKSASAKPAATKPPAAKKLPPGEVDGLMAPIALYPDQLLAQMLMAAGTPARVADLDNGLPGTEIHRLGVVGQTLQVWRAQRAEQ